MKSFAIILAACFVTSAFAVQNPSRMVCQRGLTKITVDVDVLESFPPQSIIKVFYANKEQLRFTSFTDYRILETFPPKNRWSFGSGIRSLVVSTIGRSRVGTGWYTVGRMRPLQLRCTVR